MDSAVGCTECGTDLRRTPEPRSDWARALRWASGASVITFLLSYAVDYWRIASDDMTSFSPHVAWVPATGFAAFAFVVALAIATNRFKKDAA